MDRDVPKQNEIEIGSHEIVIKNPQDFEITRVRGLVAKLLHRKPRILISGVFTEIGVDVKIVSRPALDVGSHYCTVEHEGREVRVRICHGTNVVVTVG